MSERFGYRDSPEKAKVKHFMSAGITIALIGVMLGFAESAFSSEKSRLSGTVGEYEEVYSDSCWGEGSGEYVPTVYPTSTTSFEIRATQEAVQVEREDMISKNIEDQQGQIQAEEGNAFDSFDDEYLGSTINYYVAFPIAGSNGEEELYPRSRGTALYIGESLGRVDSSGENLPIWTFLIHNHMIDSVTLDSLESGEDVYILFSGVDRETGNLEDLKFLGRLINCENIIGDGMHISSLVSIEALPKDVISGPLNEVDNYYPPYPIGSIGGPCTLGDSVMSLVSFPDDGSGYEVRPLIGEIGPPYEESSGVEVNTGIDSSYVVGSGLVNFGSSGSPVLDPDTGRVCGVVNYSFPSDNTRAGFNVLPSVDFMSSQIDKFIEESIQISVAGE